MKNMLRKLLSLLSIAVFARMLPQDPVERVEATLRAVVADSGVAVVPIDTAIPSPPSPLVPEVFEPLERVTHAMWPGVPVIPAMESGATDGLGRLGLGAGKFVSL